MANHKSAEKRNRQRPRRQLRNRNVLGSMRTALRKARAAVDAKAEDAPALVLSAVRAIDKAVTKGSLQKRAGSRLVSRLTRRNSAA